jgi:hypothetical protein
MKNLKFGCNDELAPSKIFSWFSHAHDDEATTDLLANQTVRWTSRGEEVLLLGCQDPSPPLVMLSYASIASLLRRPSCPWLWWWESTLQGQHPRDEGRLLEVVGGRRPAFSGHRSLHDKVGTCRESKKICPIIAFLSSPLLCWNNLFSTIQIRTKLEHLDSLAGTIEFIGFFSLPGIILHPWFGQDDLILWLLD